MKRFLTIIVLSLFSLGCLGQAKVTIVSKKDKLSDFPTKTMKVVLSGEDYISLSLREAVKNTWSISPYEFCGTDEFNRLKENENYYFMLIRKPDEKKDEGVSFLTIVKGGSAKINDMEELAALPVCPSDEPTGREGSYMPAILDVIQSYIDKSLADGFKNIGSMVEKAPKAGTMDLIFDKEDMSGQITDKLRQKRLSGLIEDSRSVAMTMEEGRENTMIGYTISPTHPKEGSVCYRMVFDAWSHSLYYLEKGKISSVEDRGFLKKDIMKLTAGRK